MWVSSLSYTFYLFVSATLVLPFQHLKLFVCLSLWKKKWEMVLLIQYPLQLSSYHSTPFPVKLREMLTFTQCLAFLSFSAFSSFCPLHCPPGTVGPFPVLAQFVPLVALTSSADPSLKHPSTFASRPSAFLLVLFPLQASLFCLFLKHWCPQILVSFRGTLCLLPMQFLWLSWLPWVPPQNSPQTYLQSWIEVPQGSTPRCISALHPQNAQTFIISSRILLLFLFPSFREQCPHPSGDSVLTRKTGITHTLPFVLTPPRNHKVLLLKHLKCFFFQSPLALPGYRPPPSSHLLLGLSPKWTVQPLLLRACRLFPYVARLIFPEGRFGNISLYLESYIFLFITSKYVSTSDWILQKSHILRLTSGTLLHTLIFSFWVSCFFLWSLSWPAEAEFVFFPQHTNITFFSEL